MRHSLSISVVTASLLCAAAAIAQDAAKPVEAVDAVKAGVKQTGPNEYEIGGIKFNGATREIRVPTEINFKKLPIEYMLVHETGKTHESVLKTPVSPADLQVAILLCHYEPGSDGLFHREAEKDMNVIPPVALKTPGANRFKIDVEWKAGAETKRAPLSDWMLDSNTHKPPPDGDTWIFYGSFVDHDGFAAQAQGSFIATYTDRAAMIISSAKGNWDDHIWISNPDKIPDEGTPVTVIISPAPPAVEKGKSADKANKKKQP